MTTEQSKAKPKQSLLLIGVLPSFALEHKSGSLGGTSHMLTIKNNKLNLTGKIGDTCTVSMVSLNT